jgi:N6-adenosine-specific RNA methylase IME4
MASKGENLADGSARTMAVADIKVGGRYRNDMGDIAGLAASIAEVGLLHLIVVRADGRLISGGRRLAACKMLGWTTVPVHVVDLADVVRGERAENVHRKDFTPSEWVAISDAVREIEQRAAKERQGARTDIHRGNLPQGAMGKARDKVAAYAGTSGRTLDKARAVVEAAEAQPEKFGKLKEDMDRTGKVDGPHKRLKVMRQAEEIRKEPPPLPGRGPYRVIVADPPWPYEKRDDDPSHRGVLPYLTMSVNQISSIDVASLAHQDSILWLWTTNAHMREAFAVLDAWGFAHKTILTWAKDKMGLGDWLRGQTEQCLMAVRGKPVVQLTNQTTLLRAPVREHSRKPDEFYALVEQLCPAPRYAYLFARQRGRTTGGTVTVMRRRPRHE